MNKFLFQPSGKFQKKYYIPLKVGVVLNGYVGNKNNGLECFFFYNQLTVIGIQCNISVFKDFKIGNNYGPQVEETTPVQSVDGSETVPQNPQIIF